MTGICCVMMENGVFRDYVTSALELAGFSCTGMPADDVPVICCDEWIPEIPDGSRVLVLYRRARYTRSPAYAALSERCDCRAIERPFRLDELTDTVREMTGNCAASVPVQDVPRIAEKKNNALILSRADLTASCGAFSVRLTEREFRVLDVLAEKAGETVSRETLLNDAWDGMESRGNVVDVYIGYLRKKLAPEFGKGVILAVRGAGYVLCMGECAVEWQ
ncbi:MAG: winged-helix domain-containing protein [Clostridia bacterium]|nr:winged-helix domain-containing protein [Clostridia bacterium]